MKISSAGVDLIKRFEGLILEAYQDIAGIWTIGYGHTGPDVEPSMRISEHEAAELLRSDLAWREERLSEWAAEHEVRLAQHEFDALVSFIYNVGVQAFVGSTAAKRLAAGDRAGAAEALTWWDKADLNRNGKIEPHERVEGLRRRRAAECALFLYGAENESGETHQSKA